MEFAKLRETISLKEESQNKNKESMKQLRTEMEEQYKTIQKMQDEISKQHKEL